MWLNEHTNWANIKCNNSSQQVELSSVEYNELDLVDCVDDFFLY